LPNLDLIRPRARARGTDPGGGRGWEDRASQDRKSIRRGLRVHHPGWHRERGDAMRTDLRPFEELQELVRTHPEDPEAHYALAVALFEQGDDSAACREWKRVLALQSDHAQALSFLGIVYLKQGKLGLAQEKFEEAVRLHPQDHNAWNNLGLVLARQKEFDRALTCWGEATQGPAGLWAGLVQHGARPGQPGSPRGGHPGLLQGDHAEPRGRLSPQQPGSGLLPHGEPRGCRARIPARPGDRSRRRLRP